MKSLFDGHFEISIPLQILCLINQHTSSDILFKFDCNTEIQEQNVEKGMQSISFYCIPCRNGPYSHLTLGSLETI